MPTTEMHMNADLKLETNFSAEILTKLPKLNGTSQQTI